MADPIVKEMIEAGVHFGHRTSLWNPKMAPYIFGRKNQIHIIDIRETLRGMLRAKKYLSDKLYDAMVASGVEKVTTEDGSFGTDLKEKISVATGMQEQVFEYLEEIGHGDCVKRTVHFQTLNKLFREGTLATADPELFKRWEEKAIRIRRS